MWKSGGRRLRAAAQIGILPAMLACIGFTQSAGGQSLREAFVAAHESDPTYLETIANLDVARSRSRQALAQVLPQLGLTGTNSNGRHYITHHAAFPSSDSDYRGSNAQVTFSQGLWHHANLIAIDEARSVITQGEFEVAAAEQDLGVRLIQAWFDVMSATDDFVYSQSAVAAAENGLLLVQQSRVLQLAADPEFEEALAKQERARAERAAAQTNVAGKLAALEEIIGPTPGFVAPVFAGSPPALLFDMPELKEWLDRVEVVNPVVLGARQSLEVANAEVRKQRAGHEPTLDFVASYARNSQGDGNFPGQPGYDINQRTVGLQINIPIYAGGMYSARVREAIAERSRTEHELSGTLSKVRTTVTIAWNTVVAGAEKQRAALQGMKSANLALQAATLSKERGIKADVDVLNARQQLSGSWRDPQLSRYELILGSLKLKAAIGELAAADIDQLDASMVARGPTFP